jgi:hypothetical protein
MKLTILEANKSTTLASLDKEGFFLVCMRVPTEVPARHCWIGLCQLSLREHASSISILLLLLWSQWQTIKHGREMNEAAPLRDC